MIKKVVKGCIWRVQKWLAEDPAANFASLQQLGKPPFSYEQTNQLFQTLFHSRANRPQYLWGAIQGVNLAKALGMERVSFIEFGVAGGLGLLDMEAIAASLEPIFNIGIEVHGFDSGVGLPKPSDYRDLPNIWREGFYPMDEAKLKSHLKRSSLHLGLVKETVIGFMESRPAPVAFVSFDLDHYMSTVQAFRVFKASHDVLLPRVHCYFDDIMGKSMSEFTGERLAISEFNAQRENMKISPVFGLRYFLEGQHMRWMWPDMMYIAHIFDHRLYKEYDGLTPQARADLPDEVITGADPVPLSNEQELPIPTAKRIAWQSSTRATDSRSLLRRVRDVIGVLAFVFLEHSDYMFGAVPI